MTWRWLIFFSAAAAFGATVSGQVELTNSRDPNVRRHNYAGVVLWLEPVDRPAPPVPQQHLKMIQKNKQFQPHVLAIGVGGTVDFPNFDPIFHNAFSNFSAQQFDVGLYPPGTSKAVTLNKPGIVRVFCQIHSSMSAIIAVIATPWYTVTPESGKFTINNVPPGEYMLRIFHERALPDTLKFLEHRITVPPEGLTISLISISETGYIAAPHLDKHGKPYAPETGTYGGVGK